MGLNFVLIPFLWLNLDITISAKLNGGNSKRPSKPTTIPPNVEGVCGKTFALYQTGFVKFNLEKSNQQCEAGFIGSHSDSCTAAIICTNLETLARPDNNKCEEEFIEVADYLGGNIYGCGSKSMLELGYVFYKSRKGGRDLYLRWKGVIGGSCSIFCKEDKKYYKKLRKFEPHDLLTSLRKKNPIKECECGHHNEKSENVPWVGKFANVQNDPGCPVYLISDRQALVDANCVLDTEAFKNASIVFNTHKRLDEGEVEVIRVTLDKIILHPLHNAETDRFAVAILNFHEKLDLKYYASFNLVHVCLPPQGTWEIETDLKIANREVIQWIYYNTDDGRRCKYPTDRETSTQDPGQIVTSTEGLDQIETTTDVPELITSTTEVVEPEKFQLLGQASQRCISQNPSSKMYEILDCTSDEPFQTFKFNIPFGVADNLFQVKDGNGDCLGIKSDGENSEAQPCENDSKHLFELFPSPKDDDYFELKNQETNKCVSVKRSGYAEMSPIIFWPCDHFCEFCQHFAWKKRYPGDPIPTPPTFQLLQWTSQRCLSQNPEDESSGYVIMDCKDDSSQIMALFVSVMEDSPWFLIKDSSGQCLGPGEDGMIATPQPCENDRRHYFQKIQSSSNPDYFLLKNSATGKCIQVKEKAIFENSVIILEPCKTFCENCKHLGWTERDSNDPKNPNPPQYQILGFGSQRCLSNNPANKTYEILNCKAEPSQIFAFDTLPNEEFQIRDGHGNCLTMKSDGGKVESKACNNDQKQYIKLGYFELQNKNLCARVGRNLVEEKSVVIFWKCENFCDNHKSFSWTRRNPKDAQPTLPVFSPMFNCTKEGLFPDPQSIKNYFRCARKNGALIPEHISCAENFHYVNERERLCANDPPPAKPLPFDCKDTGKFPIPDDIYKYYECVREKTKMLLFSRFCPQDFCYDDTLKYCRQW